MQCYGGIVTEIERCDRKVDELKTSGQTRRNKINRKYQKSHCFSALAVTMVTRSSVMLYDLHANLKAIWEAALEIS